MMGAVHDAGPWVVGVLLAGAVLCSDRGRAELPVGTRRPRWGPSGPIRPGSPAEPDVSAGGDAGDSPLVARALARWSPWLGGARRRERRRAAVVARLCEALDLCVAGLRAGLPLPAVLAFVEREVQDGSEVGGTIRGGASRDVRPGVAAEVVALLRGERMEGPSCGALAPAASVIGQARDLSQAAGVPLADSWEAAAGLLREHEAVRRRVAVALAGPRATMRILTLLPVAGPLVGAVFAVDPWRMYAGSPVALGCLGLGMALLAFGRWWCGQLIRRLGLGELA